jgi:hypothetical protein
MSALGRRILPSSVNVWYETRRFADASFYLRATGSWGCNNMTAEGGHPKGFLFYNRHQLIGQWAISA